MRLTVTLFILLLILTGCSVELPIWQTENRHIRSVIITADEDHPTAIEAVVEATGPVPFAVLYAGDNITGAIYEPVVGAYLGAWLGPRMTKSDFEAKTERKHAIYTLDFTLGDEFPTTWILQSIAAQAAPLIILRIPCSDDFPLVELAVFAHELGSYNLPAFIVFNPLPPQSDTRPEDYVLLFRFARTMFRSYAPMAVFVWHGVDNEATPDCAFYPGHDVVDWVSIEMLAPQNAEGFIVDIPAFLMPFYLNFQQYKPVILLPIGISHFSRRDYVYRVPEAVAEIARVYASLRDSFPRVRMIVYGDHGITTPQGDDFSITKDLNTIRAYRDAISDSHFISRLESGGIEGPIWMRSAFHGYYYENEILIDREILTSINHPVPSATTQVNERIYVNIDSVNRIQTQVDHARQVIYLEFE